MPPRIKIEIGPLAVFYIQQQLEEMERLQKRIKEIEERANGNGKGSD